MTAPHPHTSDILGPNLITWGADQFAVWYTLDGELVVGKRSRATQQWGVDHVEHLVSGAARTALALPVAADAHNYPAVAVDGLGYVHVWANMHTNPLRYIKSTNPGDVTAWAAATLPLGGNDLTRWTYPVAVPLPDGTVWLLLRAGPALSGSGRSDSFYWTLGPTATVWSAPTRLFQGINVPGAGSGGTTGSDSSVDDATNWNAYPTMPFVEERPDGGHRIHLSWCWREISSNVRSNTLPSYAYFDSADSSWHAADGTTLTLPITPLNNSACRTGLVAGAEGYLNWGGLAIDDDGRPHAVVSNSPSYHQWWNGVSWQQESVPQTLGGVTRTGRCNAVWAGGRLWLMSTGYPADARRPRLWRYDGSGTVSMGGSVGSTSDWEVHADPEAFRRFGFVETLTPDGDTPRIVSFGGGARMAVAA